MTKRFRAAFLGAVISIALLAAACGDDDGDTSGTPSSADGSATTEADAGQPVAGGSITIGEFVFPRGFDPLMSLTAHGTGGGIALIAMYDTILSWDPETGEYEGRTAESFEPNDDFTEWTLKLKPGITFTDGTPYDAEAVKFNVERHIAPTSASSSRVILSRFLDRIDVVDDTTVKFTLKEPWSGFEFLFARDVGLIASPAAIQAAGEDFNVKPGDAGAGPFKLRTFTPNETIVLERNPDYYGGEVYLDSITFVPGGPDAEKFEALQAGTFQAIVVRSAEAVHKATESDSLEALVERIPAGNVLDINAGVVITCQGGQPADWCGGKADGEKVPTNSPGADPRVRKAVAAAIDNAQVNERAYDGLAKPGPIFLDDFPLSPKVPGPEYDPDLARQLVEEAKADGWDGKIRLYSVTGSEGEALGLSVATMLEAVGMDVELDNSFDPPRLIAKTLVNRNYDLVIWGPPLGETPAANFIGSLTRYHSTGAAAFNGFSSPKMDSAVEALQVASTDEEITAAYKQIAEVWRDEVPAVSLVELRNGFLFTNKLHGVERTVGSAVLLDKAWLEK